MGAQQSVPSTAPNANEAVSTPETPAKPVCPVGYGKKEADAAVAAAVATESATAAKCPLGYGKKDGATSAPTAPVPEDKKECKSCDKSNSESACPVMRKNAPAATAPQPAAPECPVRTKKGDAYKNPNVYNVYNQKIDPTNQMPTVANQQPSPGQYVELPTERESSSIPKGGTDSTWLYPSPQMFWNALVRKNKTEGVIEEDVTSVVRIHNNMNESTWKQILEWEKIHPVEGEGKEPKLLRFLGRPDELSPKAQLKALFGHAEPFDRHDWIVDRGGKEVRYIIDYYHDEAGAQSDSAPKGMHDLSSIKSIKIDVRPALDSVSSVLDRVVLMPYFQVTGKTQFKDLPFFAEKATVAAEVKQAEQMRQTWQVIRQECEADKNKLTSCQTEQECANASIGLQKCTANIVCPKLAKEFELSLKATPFDADKTDRVYTSMVKCLELFEMDSKKILMAGKK